MPNITLTDPVTGTVVASGLFATNNSNLRTLLNGGLDYLNFKGVPALASGETMVWNGTQFDRSTTTKIGNTSLAGYPFVTAIGYATTLPGSPADGDQAILVDSTSSPTYQWMFRYHSGSSNTDKWEFIGGTPGYSEITAAETIASGTYAAMSTAGPSFAIPRAGVYIVGIGLRMTNSATNQGVVHMSYDIGGTGAVDADEVTTAALATTVPSWGNVYRERSKTLTAVTLTSKYKTTGATQTLDNRWMRVIPVRVS